MKDDQGEGRIAGLGPNPFEDVRLREDAVKAVARLKARLLITIYAPYKE